MSATGWMHVDTTDDETTGERLLRWERADGAEAKALLSPRLVDEVSNIAEVEITVATCRGESFTISTEVEPVHGLRSFTRAQALENARAWVQAQVPAVFFPEFA